MAEKLLELIEKYEEENREVEELMSIHDFSSHLISAFLIEIEKNKEFIAELNVLLNSPM